MSLVAALAYLNRFADSGVSSRTLFQGRNNLVLKSHESISFFTLGVGLGCLVGEILVGFCCELWKTSGGVYGWFKPVTHGVFLRLPANCGLFFLRVPGRFLWRGVPWEPGSCPYCSRVASPLPDQRLGPFISSMQGLS